MYKLRFVCGLLGLTLGLGLSAQAQVQRSFLNTSFEQPALLGGACYAQVYDNSVPFWNTTATVNTPNGSCTLPTGTPSGLIEIWTNNFNGVPARDGVQFAELNADQSSALYQNICITKGEVVTWGLSHRGRAGVDTMAFVLGDSPASLSPANLATTATVGGILRASTSTAGAGTIVSCQSGSSVGNNTACTTSTTNTWADYRGAFVWNGTSGVKSVGFGSISTSGGNQTVGNLLDNITLTLKPYLEFNTPPSSGLESVASPATLGIKVVGNVATAFTVPVTVTGGTATLGVDFTTPGGGSTFNVTIPVGNYSTASVIPLGITIINDTIAETNETITFSIAPSTVASSYVTTSTKTCGDLAVLTTTYTILDDDRPTISINKTRVGGVGTLNFGFSGTNGVPAALTNIPTTASGSSTTVAALTNVAITTDGVAVTFTETQPSPAWQLTAASCLDANAGNAQLGNTNPATNVAIFSGNTVTIPAANVQHSSVFNCSVTNTLKVADLVMSKTDGKTSAIAGDTNIYTITVLNNGPAAADGTVVADPATPNLSCTSISCAAAGGATCPAAPTVVAFQSPGLSIPALPNAGSVTFTLSCSVL